MEKLSKEKEEELKSTFSRNIGKVIETKRKKCGYHQKDLAGMLGVSISTISNYESAARGMEISMLPLISTYCDFSIKEYFKEDTINMLDEFKTIIKIAKEKETKYYERMTTKEANVKLVAKIYDINGKEIREEIKPKYDIISSREKLIFGHEIVDEEPFSKEEANIYLNNLENKDAIVKTIDLLNEMQGFDKKETLTNQLFDFVLNETFIISLNKNCKDAKRFYAYYCKMFSFN